MKAFLIEPASSVANINVGEVFKLEDDGKLYLLIHRDAARCVCRPWTWWDKFIVRCTLVILKIMLRFKS